MGYSRIGRETTDELLTGQRYTDDDYIWTYVSPEFPMSQVQQSTLKFSWLWLI